MTIKSKNVFKPLLISLSIASALVAGCGGGGTGSSPGSGSVTTSQGQFVDSPVQGLRYDAGSGVTGVTDENGMFRYVQGQDVRFFLDNVPFGTARGAEIITPVDLARRDTGVDSDAINFESPGLLNRLRLLQILDNDTDPDNGIVLRSITGLANGGVINFTEDLANFVLNNSALQSLLGAAGLDTNTVRGVDASFAHFESYARTNLFQGCYKGAVENLGTLAITVQPDGTMSGVLTSPQEIESSVQGNMRGDGSFTLGRMGVSLTEITGKTIPLKSQAVSALKFGQNSGTLIMRNFDPLPDDAPAGTPDPSLSNTTGCPPLPV